MIHPTDTERQFWEENGYLILAKAITDAKLTHLQQAFDRYPWHTSQLNRTL